MGIDHDEVRPEVAETRNASLEALKSVNASGARGVVSELEETETIIDDHSNAQRLVDRLSDSGFPVEDLQIVGTGIRSIALVLGSLLGCRLRLRRTLDNQRTA